MSFTIEDEVRISKALADASVAVASYRGTDQTHTLIAMLDLLAGSYVVDLMHCKPEALAHYQAAIKQALMIKRVLEGDASVSPRI